MDDEEKSLARILREHMGKKVVLRYSFDGERETRYHLTVIPIKFELGGKRDNGTPKAPRLIFWQWSSGRSRWEKSKEWLSELRFMRVVE